MSLNDLLRHRLRLRKQVKIIRSAGLRIRARHVEAAERMRADHRPRALAIDVQISYVKLADRLLDLVAGLSVDSARQPELRVVRNLQRVIETSCLDYRKHRSKNF